MPVLLLLLLMLRPAVWVSLPWPEGGAGDRKEGRR